MADVHLKCSSCGKEIVVSEFVAAKSVSCPGCGEQLHMEKTEKTEVLKLKKRPSKTEVQQEEGNKPNPKTFVPPTEPQPDEEEETGSANPTLSQIRKRSVSRKEKMRAKRSVVALVVCWILFVIAAAAMYYFRFVYIKAQPDSQAQTLIDYGLMAVGVAYVLCILIAVKDNMFDGFLALVIPGYPFYYIFMVSTAIFIRALVAGLFVGFGYDLLLFLQANATKAYNAISYWIGHQ